TTSPSPISLPLHELSSQSLPRYAHLSPSPSLTNLSRSSRSISADPANVLGSRGNGANSSTGEDGGGVIHPGTPKKVARRRVLLRKEVSMGCRWDQASEGRDCNPQLVRSSVA
ncbi:unnamed protein product, partial [Musa acuminata subsp. burmannicoides]